MALTRKQKEEIVEKTTNQLKNSSGVIFTDFTGVGVESMRNLRNALRESGASYQAIKRTLVKIALKNVDVEVGNNIQETSLGLVTFPEDLPAAAKVLYNFSKSEKNFKLLNAITLEEKKWMSVEDVLTLAKLPSREELLAQLAYVLMSPIKKLAYVTNKIAQQKA